MADFGLVGPTPFKTFKPFNLSGSGFKSLKVAMLNRYYSPHGTVLADWLFHNVQTPSVVRPTVQGVKCWRVVVLSIISSVVSMKISATRWERSPRSNLVDSDAGLLSIWVMELRDHPLMTRKSGVKAWPPMWTTRQPNNKQKPLGEIGILEQALMTEWFNNKIFVFVQYQGFRYMGLLQFDDPEFCNEIFVLLKAQLGRTIQDIGDLDLSHTL